MGSYSTDMLKRAAFHDELVNVLALLPIDQDNIKIVIVRQYLERRMAEIDKAYK